MTKTDFAKAMEEANTWDNGPGHCEGIAFEAGAEWALRWLLTECKEVRGAELALKRYEHLSLPNNACASALSTGAMVPFAKRALAALEKLKAEVGAGEKGRE
jgi:hypothetical protein